MKNGIKNGLFASAALIVLFLVVNLINPKLNFGIVFSLVTNAVIQIFFMIRAGREERKNYDGYLSLGEAFIPTFVTFAISSLISGAFVYAMIKYDPKLLEIVAESSKEMAEGVMSMTGMSEDQIALGLEEQETVLAETNPFSLAAMAVNWFVSLLIPGMIYTLIASLASRKKKDATA